MPVKGTVRVMKFEDRIENTLVGKKVFIMIDDLIATRKGIFIDIENEVVFEQDIEENKKFEYVPITRLGPGFSDRDWKLDLTELDEPLELESDGAYHYFMRNIGKYIHFSSAKLELVDENEESIPILNVEPVEIEEHSSLSEIDQLVQDLKDAEEKQDYEKAASIVQELKDKGWKQN
jgi:hypothetical protein